MIMLKEALAAAGQGLPVFPCHPNDKQPLVSSTRARGGGVKLATTDEKQIRAWWKKWPDAMIGMRCGTRASGGAGIFVIDIDPKHGETATSLLKRLSLYIAEHHVAGEGVDQPGVRALDASVSRAMVYELSCPVMVKTPRGGLHLWYRAVDGLDIGNRGDLLKGRIEQIDVRGASLDAATGEYKPGYVIIPPSTRHGKKAIEEGCDGVAYQWVRGGVADLIEPPAEVVELVRERHRETANPASRGAPGRVYQKSEALPPIDMTDARAIDARADAIRKHVEAALDGELARARSHKGNRNNDLNAAAVSLGKLIPGGFLNEAEVRGLLEQEAVNNGLVKDDGLHTVRATIDSGIEYGKRNPRDLNEVGRLAGRSTRPPPVTAAVRFESSPFDDADYFDQVEDYGYSSSSIADQKPRNPSKDTQVEPADSGGGGGDSGSPISPLGDDDGPQAPLDMAKLGEAAVCEVNDTGNAERLRIWHGEKFLDVNVAEGPGGVIGLHYWDGVQWQSKQAWEEIGKLAQQVPPLIQAEAELVQATELEEHHIASGASAETALASVKAELANVAGDAKAKVQARIDELDALIERAQMAKDAIQARKNAKRKFGKSSGNKPRLEAMIGLARMHVTYDPDDMDAEPLAMNCQNGTLRAVKGKNAEGKLAWSLRLDPHDPDDLISRSIACDYTPGSTATRWLAFVGKVQPNPDNLRFLQIWHGLGLTGLVEQAFVLNYGTGANGKSTFIETLAELQGEYAVTLPAEAIVGDQQRRGDQATPDLAKLPGARLVRCGELPRGQTFRENILKLLTGGDKVPVRHLHGRFFDLKPQFKAVGQCNEKPDISGVDEGIWRRVKLVEWNVAIPLHERRSQKEVMGEFAAERPGILNWLLDGLMLYLNAGEVLHVPPDVIAATESYRKDSDPVGAFEAACLTRKPGSRVTAFQMYKSFVAFCHANSIRPWSQKAFGAVLKTKKYEKVHANVFEYLEVELHDVPDDPIPNDSGQLAGGRYSRRRDDLGYAHVSAADLAPDRDPPPRPSEPPQPIGPYAADEETRD